MGRIRGLCSEQNCMSCENKTCMELIYLVGLECEKYYCLKVDITRKVQACLFFSSLPSTIRRVFTPLHVLYLYENKICPECV